MRYCKFKKGYKTIKTIQKTFKMRTHHSGLKDYPFITEAIAIDVSNSLTGAEIGIRGFRNRGFLSKLWDGIIGKNNEYISQFSSDLLISQKAKIEYLKILAESEVHTQRCLIKVSRNLLKSIEDIQIVDNKINETRVEINARVTRLQNSLTNKLEMLDFKVQREQELRRLTAKYKSGILYQDIAPLINAALYIAQIRSLFWGESQKVLDKEIQFARNIIKENPSFSNAESLSDIIFNSVSSTKEKHIPMLLYITSRSNSSILKVLNLSFSKVYSGIEINREKLKEDFVIAEALSDDDFLKKGEIFTPFQIIRQLSNEFTNGFNIE